MPRKVNPLTIRMIRKKYWNKRVKKGKLIKMYTGQVYGGKDINGKSLTTKSEELGIEYFIPDGNLIHKWGKPIYPLNTGPIKWQYQQISIDWLSKRREGPYLTSEYNTSSNHFYYLTGSDKQGNYKMLQVCSGPLNVLALNCMGEVICYV